MKTTFVIPTNTVSTIVNCQMPGCAARATHIASGRSDYADNPSGYTHPAMYCEAHAFTVADEGDPGYIAACPNCGCQFGVN